MNGDDDMKRFVDLALAFINEIYPTEECPEITREDFDMWYRAMTGYPDVLFETGTERERMLTYMPYHAARCSVCKRRYKASTQIDSFFKAAFGNKEEERVQ